MKRASSLTKQDNGKKNASIHSKDNQLGLRNISILRIGKSNEYNECHVGLPPSEMTPFLVSAWRQLKRLKVQAQNPEKLLNNSRRSSKGKSVSLNR